jgi:hypothetical protein
MLLADPSQPAGNGAVREDTAASARGRFVRVTFLGQPAGQSASLAELEVVGSVE